MLTIFDVQEWRWSGKQSLGFDAPTVKDEFELEY